MKGDINPRKKSRSLDELEQDLYNPALTPEQRPRRKIHDRDIHLEQDFNESEYDHLLHGRPKFQLPTSLFKKIFFGVLGFFIVSVLIFSLSLYQSRTSVSGELIAMEIIAQPFVDGGEDLALQVRIQNFNEQTLQLPDLVISYPRDSGINAERTFLRRSLTDVANQQRITEDFNLILFGQAGDIREIEATLEYRIEGSSSIFIKEVSHEVIIRSTPTELSLVAPNTVVRNQEVKLVFEVSSNSITRVNNTVLKVQYPQGFEFIRSNIPSDFNNNTWTFDYLSEEPDSIEIIGRLSALEGQSRSFTAQFGRQNPLNKNQIETVFNAITHTVDVQRSFIDVDLVINNISENESTLRGGGTMNVVLRYTNTLNEALENVIITLNLEGDLYDTNRINLQNGFYNSSRKAIIFDQTTSERLRLVQPGQGAEFRFTLYGKDLVGTGGVLTNPSLEMTADVEATRPNGNNEKAAAVSRHMVRANSDIAVLTKTQHAEGPFDNAGPMPPRVNMPTNYTLVFSITNSSNNLTNAELSTFLPPYVEWMNIVAPSIERTNINFDATTRKLTWRLGEVTAGLGVGTSQPRQLSVQVTLTPSVSHLGNAVDMTQDIVLIGTDAFTGTELSYRKTPLTNRLQNTSVVGYDGRVVQ